MDGMIALKTVAAIRYIVPLREGGSVPAVVEADDGETYVMKFTAAGQGRKALIAELLAGEIGRVLGLPIPAIVFVELDPDLSRSEPHPEIQSVLRASAGLNFGMRFIRQATAFDALLAPPPDGRLASEIVWFDAYVTNVDRTPRNVNMLMADGGLWLIDHGAALYFHHNWNGYMAHSRSAFPLIKDHVLLPLAAELREADVASRSRLTPNLLREIVDLIPDVWLAGEPAFAGMDAHREAYAAYLTARLESASAFVEEAIRARAQCV